MTSLLCCRDRGRCIVTAPLRFEARERRGIDPLSLSQLPGKTGGHPFDVTGERVRTSSSQQPAAFSVHTHTQFDPVKREKKKKSYLFLPALERSGICYWTSSFHYIYIYKCALVNQWSKRSSYFFLLLSLCLSPFSSSCRWRRSGWASYVSQKKRRRALGVPVLLIRGPRNSLTASAGADESHRCRRRCPGRVVMYITLTHGPLMEMSRAACYMHLLHTHTLRKTTAVTAII